MKKNVNIVDVVVAMILVILIAVMSGCGGQLETVPYNDAELQKIKDTRLAEKETSPVEELEVFPFAIYRW